MCFIVQKNALKKINNKKNIQILIVPNNKNKIKKNTKETMRSSRLKRLEDQLKSNILKRKSVKKNNG